MHADRRMAELLIRQKLVSREQVDECLALIEAGRRQSLEDLLAEKGYLKPADSGRYEKRERIGAGGMGEVWKAWDRELERWVALKLVKDSDPGEFTRFQREAQTAAALNHPNIASVYEVGKLDDVPFIAMQFVDGAELGKEKRPTRETVALVRDAARAVHAAHEQNVIHRDLKPANIMVDREGRIFVMDFGLAKRSTVDSSISVTGAILGTPSYMSPEQAQGHNDQVDARSDVYSLGATLHELLTGSPPFGRGAPFDVLRKVVDGDPTPPKGVDPELSNIVAKCLEKLKSRRYGSAAALADDIERYLKGEPVAAHSQDTFYRLRKKLGKRKGVVSAMLGGVIAVVVVSAWFIPKWIAAAGQAEEANLYLPLEAELNQLRMNFYRTDFRLTEKKFGEYETLMERIRGQMDRTGESGHGWYLIGRCREIMADYAGADAAYAKSPDHASSLLSRGRLGLHRLIFKVSALEYGKYESLWKEQAKRYVEMVERGVRVSGDLESMQLDLARAYQLLVRDWLEKAPHSFAMEKRRWAQEPFVEEFTLLEGLSGGHDDLIQACDKVLKAVPSYYEAWLWRGIVHLANKRLKEARRDIQKAIDIHFRSPDGYYNRGAVSREENHHEEALRDFNRVLETEPDRAQALIARGNTYQDLGRLEEAIADYTRAISLLPEMARTYYNRANALMAKGDDSAAMEDYDRSIRILPDFAPSHLNRGILKRRLGDLDGAMMDMDQAIAHDPKFPLAYYNRAALKYSRKNLEGAIEDWTRVIDLVPDNAAAYNSRGRARSKLGEHAPALADWDRAIEIQPKYTLPYVNRGMDRLRRGDRKGAILDFEEALRLAPPDWKPRPFVEEELRKLRD